MSFVTDQVRRIDGQLDRLQLASGVSTSSSPELRSQQHESLHTSQSASANSPKVKELQTTIRSLSTASSAQPLIQSSKLQYLLEQYQASVDLEDEEERDSYEQELEWLLVSKATTQTYGLILDSFLNQIIPLSEEIWYWDEVLSSYTYSSLYTLQTTPSRLWNISRDIYSEARQRFDDLISDEEYESVERSASLSSQWRQFYGLVTQTVRDRSIADVQSKIMSPVTRARLEARQKQKSLRKLREMSASGLGVLMDEGLSFVAEDSDSEASKNDSGDHSDEWRSIVSKSVALMETVLSNVTSLESGVSEFEDTVFANVENDPEETQNDFPNKPAILARRLHNLLNKHIPNHAAASRRLSRQYGRPSRIVRYWLPATVLLLSSSAILRIFFNNKTKVLNWIRDFGTTVEDFWFNWVVSPIKKVIGTIRHDKESEIAIMSKRSLEGDRDSLERMVVDFAVDNAGKKSALNESAIADIRAKVKEGDLTPVLRAYEQDLKKPFLGAVKGDLIRALLIQVQKTKVDVEVAIGGIDTLLKSQELVFGFVGLTPGLLVCIGLSRWLAQTFSNRSSSTNSKSRRQTRMIRVLRNIDRILSASSLPTSSSSSTSNPHHLSVNNGMLSYKEHGLLLCEAHILRQDSEVVFSGRAEVRREFLEDVADLVDIRQGVERQSKVVERIRWSYWKWLVQ